MRTTRTTGKGSRTTRTMRKTEERRVQRSSRLATMLTSRWDAIVWMEKCTVLEVATLVVPLQHSLTKKQLSTFQSLNHQTSNTLNPSPNWSNSKGSKLINSKGLRPNFLAIKSSWLAIPRLVWNSKMILLKRFQLEIILFKKFKLDTNKRPTANDVSQKFGMWAKI